jgi:predicted  nucleic acid-binding Zn-ribbon protein
MPDLGKKYECFNCGTKFYNLGKPEAVCPKCGANQKDARSDESPAPAPRPPRRSILMEPIPDETSEFEEGGGGGGGGSTEEENGDADEDEFGEEEGGEEKEEEEEF